MLRPQLFFTLSSGQSILNVLKEKALLKKPIFSSCLLDTIRAKYVNEVKRFFSLEKTHFYTDRYWFSGFLRRIWEFTFTRKKFHMLGPIGNTVFPARPWHFQGILGAYGGCWADLISGKWCHKKFRKILQKVFWNDLILSKFGALRPLSRRSKSQELFCKLFIKFLWQYLNKKNGRFISSSIYFLFNYKSCFCRFY